MSAAPRPREPLIIATRASELAVRQARQVQDALAQRGVVAELKTYRTTGDKRLDEPLSAIGGKGLFTRELETDLARGAVDCCVHSLKDLPTDSPPGLTIGAVLAREDPRDVLVVSSAEGRSSCRRGLHAQPAARTMHDPRFPETSVTSSFHVSHTLTSTGVSSRWTEALDRGPTSA